MSAVKRSFLKNGFTLAELLIAIAILGILASIALPRFFPQTERARTSEAVGILSAIRQGEEAFFLENGAYYDPTPSGNWNPLGMDNPNPNSDFFVFTVSVNNSAVPPTFTGTATRNAAQDGMGMSAHTITLDQNGDWGGTHQFVP